MGLRLLCELKQIVLGSSLRKRSSRDPSTLSTGTTGIRLKILSTLYLESTWSVRTGFSSGCPEMYDSNPSSLFSSSLSSFSRLKYSAKTSTFPKKTTSP